VEASRVETPTLQNCLDSLTDGGKVVRLTHPSPSTPMDIPGTHFSYRLSRLQGLTEARMNKSIEKYNDRIGNLTHDLPACGIVPRLTTL
jgi:NADPH:quinone reductase-like Zn-dependent oxidoreductase